MIDMHAAPTPDGPDDRRHRESTVRCTLTGLDAFTTPDAAQALLYRPGVELALLLSLDQVGPRFVSLQQAHQWLTGLKGDLALHLCGTAIRQAVLDGQLDALLPAVSRVQVNGPIAADQARAIRAHLRSVDWMVTQHVPEDPRRPSLAQLPMSGHALLVDASSGLGLLPRHWNRPETDKPVGFAGGLSPLNLADELPRIARVAVGDWWIDAETALRDEQDRFDPIRAHAFVDAAEHWARSRADSGKGAS